jgi:hypothetical protein
MVKLKSRLFILTLYVAGNRFIAALVLYSGLPLHHVGETAKVR